MVGLGVLLIVLGFGSLILEQFGYVFRLLEWAEDYQPGIGIGVGVLGIVLVVAGIAMKKKNETNITVNNNPPQGYDPNQAPQGYNPNQPPPQQGYNQPPQGQQYPPNQ